ncbi:Vacuolar protein sorting-associated protein 13, partial [Friedmanniomyces endolithicus]
MQIFQRASSMQSAGGEKKLADEGPKKLDQIKADAAESGKPKPKSTKKAVASTAPQAKTIATQKSGAKAQREEDSAPQGSAVLKREELRIQMEGIRVVLIGDLHELPILDWSVAKFGVEVRDWTGNMTADTSLDTYFNVYNFSKSAWEPLIEPWTLGFHMAKEGDKMSVEVFSRKMLELTVTSATIALASKSAQFLSSEEDVLSKPRGNDAPYRIRNFTGFEVDVWAGGESTGDEGEAAKLADGEERAWRFEDPSTTRETLSPEGQNGVI